MSPGLSNDDHQPLLQQLLAAGHGGGKLPAPLPWAALGAEVQQGPAVGYPILLAQDLQRPLVTGQLAVLLRQGRGSPHQGVVPVQAQTCHAHYYPEIVPMAVVDVLMTQHVPEGLRLTRRLSAQVYRRAGQAEHAWAFHHWGYIDGKSAGYVCLAALSGYAHPSAVSAVHHQDAAGEKGCPQKPDVPEKGMFPLFALNPGIGCGGRNGGLRLL